MIVSCKSECTFPLLYFSFQKTRVGPSETRSPPCTCTSVRLGRSQQFVVCLKKQKKLFCFISTPSYKKKAATNIEFDRFSTTAIFSTPMFYFDNRMSCYYKEELSVSLCYPLYFVIQWCFAAQKVAEQGCVNHKLGTGKVGWLCYSSVKEFQVDPGESRGSH